MAFSANHSLGQIHAALGDQREAVIFYRRALACGRVRDPSLYHHLGIALAELEQYGDAEAWLLQSIAHKPGAWWSCKALGELMLKQRRYAEAETFLRKTISLHNSDPWSYFHLLEAQLSTVGPDAAVANWLDGVLAAPVLAELPVRLDPWKLDQPRGRPGQLEKIRRLAERYPDSEQVGYLASCILVQHGHGREGTAFLSDRMGRAWRRRHDISAAAGARTKIPEFLIIGTVKGGSTALYDYLVDHPLVCPGIVKEVNFWNTHHSHGYDWYRACFMPIPETAPHITGDGSVCSLWHAEAPPRLAAFRSDIKLLLILREPVARAYSEYQMRRRLGRELREWEAVIERELEQFPRCPLQPEDLPRPYNEESLLVNGAVLPFLKTWLRHFPANQLLILRNEDLARDVSGTVGTAYEFLGLPPHQITSTARSNVGKYPPMPSALGPRLRQWYQPHQNALAEFLGTETA